MKKGPKDNTSTKWMILNGSQQHCGSFMRSGQVRWPMRHVDNIGKLAGAHGFDKNSLADLINWAWWAEVHELSESSPYREDAWNYLG